MIYLNNITVKSSYEIFLAEDLEYKFEKGKGKGKVHSKTDHGGPEREKRYSSRLLLTSAQMEVGG